MTVRRRGQRVKTGLNTYANYNSKGQLSSTSSKMGDTTSTVFLKGGVRTSQNLGGGYFNVMDSRRGRPRPKRRTGHQGGAGVEIAFAVAVFVLWGTFRIVAWCAALAWDLYQSRRRS